MSLSQEELTTMAARWLPRERVPRRIRVHTDTTDFFRVEYDDVVVLKGRPYLVRHSAKEPGLGEDEDIKFWVKRAMDLEDGSAKILKLVFYEEFKLKNLEYRIALIAEQPSRLLSSDKRGHVAGPENTIFSSRDPWML